MCNQLPQAHLQQIWAVPSFQWGLLLPVWLWPSFISPDKLFLKIMVKQHILLPFGFERKGGDALKMWNKTKWQPKEKEHSKLWNKRKNVTLTLWFQVPCNVFCTIPSDPKVSTTTTHHYHCCSSMAKTVNAAATPPRTNTAQQRRWKHWCWWLTVVMLPLVAAIVLAMSAGTGAPGRVVHLPPLPQLQANNRLEHAEHLFQDEWVGPESFAFDAKDRMYAGTWNIRL